MGGGVDFTAFVYKGKWKKNISCLEKVLWNTNISRYVIHLELYFMSKESLQSILHCQLWNNFGLTGNWKSTLDYYYYFQQFKHSLPARRDSSNIWAPCQKFFLSVPSQRIRRKSYTRSRVYAESKHPPCILEDYGLTSPMKLPLWLCLEKCWNIGLPFKDVQKLHLVLKATVVNQMQRAHSHTGATTSLCFQLNSKSRHCLHSLAPGYLEYLFPIRASLNVEIFR